MVRQDILFRNLGFVDFPDHEGKLQRVRAGRLRDEESLVDAGRKDPEVVADLIGNPRKEPFVEHRGCPVNFRFVGQDVQREGAVLVPFRIRCAQHGEDVLQVFHVPAEQARGVGKGEGVQFPRIRLPCVHVFVLDHEGCVVPVIKGQKDVEGHGEVKEGDMGDFFQPVRVFLRADEAEYDEVPDIAEIGQPRNGFWPAFAGTSGCFKDPLREDFRGLAVQEAFIVAVKVDHRGGIIPVVADHNAVKGGAVVPLEAADRGGGVRSKGCRYQLQDQRFEFLIREGVFCFRHL